ncbi:MAG: hypothetical protein DHS20C01_01250 [marine bacterium B5-7]|nr:MAG: hypothetical protein DHS20C01_01250 [marine bacterium B5-7]
MKTNYCQVKNDDLNEYKLVKLESNKSALLSRKQIASQSRNYTSSISYIFTIISVMQKYATVNLYLHRSQYGE